MIEQQIAALMEVANQEDIRGGDHTSNACIREASESTAVLKIKEDGVVSGVKSAMEIFRWMDSSILFKGLIEDGDEVQVGAKAFEVKGNTRNILAAERTVLNLMQRMSGISTTTRKYSDAISHTSAKVLDTRKTTPGLRWFEKEAVRHGGGTNHRFGLFDMILIKDNHIDAAGGVKEAIQLAVEYCQSGSKDLKIEVEVRDFDELDQTLEIGSVDRVMLDNFSHADTRRAVEIINGQLEVESSGGITLDTITGYAEAGVDFISVGAITHSVKCLDMSLKIKA